jgi:hypothetical protein
MTARPIISMKKLAEAHEALQVAVDMLADALPEGVVEEEFQTGASKSLTVKLPLRDYWALRDFCAQRGRTTGRRLTHQDAMILGLHRLLEQEAA